MSALIKFPPGYEVQSGVWTRGFRAFILEGELTISAEEMESETWFESAPNEEHQGISSPDGALIFAKITGTI
jgi:hypothetical protein